MYFLEIVPSILWYEVVQFTPCFVIVGWMQVFRFTPRSILPRFILVDNMALIVNVKTHVWEAQQGVTAATFCNVSFI